MKLFIVESPGKCGTLRKILGSEYCVEASIGHIRSIPAKGMNIDIENGFAPKFEVSKGREDVVKKIKKLAAESDEVILATDDDREGEAIAFHLFDVLPKRDQKKCTRITYKEITKAAVTNALKNKRKIDDDMVDAQKARQVLDRLIGYTISPLLWKKVASKTSAGRVQSVALKIVSDRETEIKAFKPTDFWYVDADLKSKKGDFTARVVTKDRDNRYLDQKVLENEYKELESAIYKVEKVLKKAKSVKPNPPFDTSSLQTTASTLFNWPIKKTAKVAQSLYEKGKVTYIRTDSYSIAPEAVSAARALIKSKVGDTYLPSKANIYKKTKGANQEAHECIRPTDCTYTGDDLGVDDQKLYRLIRERLVACQMKPMIVDTVTYKIKTSSKHSLIAKGQSVSFDGWSKVYRHLSTKNKILPSVVEGESLDLNHLNKIKGATKPPPRYNEGSLVKKMEDEGVGRPSTYPSIMENIRNREYVRGIDKKGTLEATELGIKVSSYLSDHFDEFIMNVKYTAELEESLDIICNGKATYLDVVKSTYDQMLVTVNKARGDSVNITGSAKCSKCKGGSIVERFGKYGAFYSCDQYPTCKSSYVLGQDGKFQVKEAFKPEKGPDCPECKKNKRGGVLLKRKNRKENSFFYGCSEYPKCKHTSAATA